jgi:diadenosine tetraphosphate (Ap4A) HIT family hydrolase
MDPCVFCEIVAGRSPASVVARDDRSIAFMDIRPVTPGHLLVIPTAHLPSLADLPDNLAAHLFLVATRLAAAVRRSGLRCEGVDLFLADGEAAGQEVFHAHLHVIPRWAGDGFTIKVAAYDAPAPERAELDANAAAIRGALASP